MKFAVLLSLLITSHVFASGSFGVRGGGNTCVEHFIGYGKVLNQNVSGIDYDKEAFLEKVKTAEIVEVQTEMVMFDGNQYIAMNEPSTNTIYLSQKWCRESREIKQENNSALIVFHEILGLSQPGADKNYYISGDLYNKTGLTEEDFYYLNITGGKDRHLFKTEAYTWARRNYSYSQRAFLRLDADTTKASAIIDCDAKPENPAVLVIMGAPNEYSFFNKMMCDNLMEFLNFRDYSNIKVSFLVGTVSDTIYDVIKE